MDDCCRHWIAVRLRCLVLPLLQAPAPPQGAQFATRHQQTEVHLLHRGSDLHYLSGRIRLLRYRRRSGNMFAMEKLLPRFCRHWNPNIRIPHHPGCFENTWNSQWSLWISDSIPHHQVSSSSSKVCLCLETSTSNPFLCAADFILQLGSCKKAVR